VEEVAIPRLGASSTEHHRWAILKAFLAKIVIGDAHK
jgi:hypothetical protein